MPNIRIAGTLRHKRKAKIATEIADTPAALRIYPKQAHGAL
ncbi:MAG TPA: hypothetical protein VFK88_06055 [Gallionella sp.]|nr:hypothetical protein [Gallionella sp.]